MTTIGLCPSPAAKIFDSKTIFASLTAGGISGGTISSVLNIFAGMTVKKALESADPFSLAPRDEATGVPLRATGRT
jgi:hypothetical protein